jgi:hypothetical protein
MGEEEVRQPRTAEEAAIFIVWTVANMIDQGSDVIAAVNELSSPDNRKEIEAAAEALLLDAIERGGTCVRSFMRTPELVTRVWWV